MDGIELARRASELDPDIKLMFITGFAAVALNAANQAPEDAKVLSKPFHLKDLVDINCSPVLDCLEAASARCTPWHQRGSTDHNRIVGRLQQQLDFDLTVQPFVHNAKRFSWELANNVTRGARLPQEFQGIDSQRPQ
jgi:CheY-like chemotaxis protein